MKPSSTDVKLRISLAAAGVLMILFTLARMALWFSNGAFFAPLSEAEITSAFIHGLQFDFYMVALCLEKPHWPEMV